MLEDRTTIAEIVGAAACIPYNMKHMKSLDIIAWATIDIEGSKKAISKNEINSTRLFMSSILPCLIKPNLLHSAYILTYDIYKFNTVSLHRFLVSAY